MQNWLPKRRVVVPLDFSEDSIRALDIARSFVKDLSEIHVVHVLPRLSAMEPGVRWGDVTEETRKSHVEKAIRERMCKDHDCDNVVIAVRLGKASRQIVAYAKEIDAELIVIASHGEGAGHALVGSSAERVVHLAHCPVLVVKN